MMKVTEVVAAFIWQNNKFMICQRPVHKARGLLGELVGGKVESGEGKEQALIRECQEELTVALSIGDVFMDVVHEYRSFKRRPHLISFLDSVVNKLVNREGVAKDKIIILSDRKKAKSVLSEIDTLGGCSLDDIYDGNTETIKYRTIQSFKGLEADVVIFLHHTYKNEPQTERKRALLYTALTRARFFLYCADYEENIELREE